MIIYNVSKSDDTFLRKIIIQEDQRSNEALTTLQISDIRALYTVNYTQNHIIYVILKKINRYNVFDVIRTLNKTRNHDNRCDMKIDNGKSYQLAEWIRHSVHHLVASYSIS